MPEELVILSPPVQASERNFYPVVRISHKIHTPGGWMLVSPVAVLIEENGTWFFTALEGGIEAETTIEGISRSQG